MVAVRVPGCVLRLAVARKLVLAAVVVAALALVVVLPRAFEGTAGTSVPPIDPPVRERRLSRP